MRESLREVGKEMAVSWISKVQVVEAKISKLQNFGSVDNSAIIWDVVKGMCKSS